MEGLVVFGQKRFGSLYRIFKEKLSDPSVKLYNDTYNWDPDPACYELKGRQHKQAYWQDYIRRQFRVRRGVLY